MKTSKNTFFPATTSFVASALVTIFFLGFVAAPTLAKDTTSQANTTLQDVVVKGTEYQPNMLQADGSHLKVKKHLKAAKPLVAKTTNGAQLTVSEKIPLSRELARNNDDIDFWIYDSFVTFTADIDYDGYYSSFTLEFDVDTVYTSAPIYAVIYTSTSDVFTPFYTTDIYDIYGDNTQDAIIIENDLVTGFPSNDYELMIIIYDADTDEVVAVADGTDDADLAYLSLESEDYEYVESVEIVVVEHGGAFGIWLIAGLGFITYRRFNV
ncbi:MAG: hypothetical protein ACI9IT_000485 [Glaciecola sp.]|jgi:hypothetical protein